MKIRILKVLYLKLKKKFGNGSYLMRGSQNLNSSLVFSMEPDCFFIGPLAPLAAHTWNLPAPPTGSLWGLQAPSA